jgi:hypothetical protein
MGATLLAFMGLDPKGWEERFRTPAPQRDVRLWPECLGTGSASASPAGAGRQSGSQGGRFAIRRFQAPWTLDLFSVEMVPIFSFFSLTTLPPVSLERR